MVRHLPDLLQGTVLPLIGRILRQPRIPLTLLLVVALLYFQFGKLGLCLLVMTSVPFAVIGSAMCQR